MNANPPATTAPNTPAGAGVKSVVFPRPIGPHTPSNAKPTKARTCAAELKVGPVTYRCMLRQGHTNQHEEHGFTQTKMGVVEYTMQWEPSSTVRLRAAQP